MKLSKEITKKNKKISIKYFVMNDSKEFKNFAINHLGINSLTLDTYSSMYSNYISPTITEERKMNVATMDVFSRLMMDRMEFSKWLNSHFS